ncbi:4-hydroxy-tetrahydrodipicolinate reductase [Flavobacterium sp. UBA4197]|uniref:4-hydroxy-tetrahydrodipicolinate reductase n=1 Tax=Flavobacterium sp. UBA4197 TaxID=1946546 RepID=UPI00257A40F4|nr:4-hydroxy-tetrahydrodipicolinate reductase [Flavobacterium sp. UBA4197]
MEPSHKIRVCVAGATGWAASELSKGIAATTDLELVAAVARKTAGKNLNTVLGFTSEKNIPIFSTLEEALQIPCDVLIDYTAPEIARHHILTALHKGVAVVVGTSGLSDADYDEIGRLATEKRRPVLAVGNFAISVVLLNKFAEMASQYMPHWEIIDYASDTKVDAPSGSALELANRLSKQQAVITIPTEAVQGEKATRGANIGGTQVHAVRLPGYVISLETIFGMESEKLILKHEAGDSAKPYVKGALLAIRKVNSFTGLKRGLDQVMDF